MGGISHTEATKLTSQQVVVAFTFVEFESFVQRIILTLNAKLGMGVVLMSHHNLISTIHDGIAP